MNCNDCDIRSEAISESIGMKYRTLCNKCRDALIRKVQNHPMKGKKGNHANI